MAELAYLDSAYDVDGATIGSQGGPQYVPPYPGSRAAQARGILPRTQKELRLRDDESLAELFKAASPLHLRPDLLRNTDKRGAQIDSLYAQLAELSSVREDGGQYERLLAQLRELQAEESSELIAMLVDGMRIDLDETTSTIDRADEIIAQYEDSPTTDSTAKDTD